MDTHGNTQYLVCKMPTFSWKSIFPRDKTWYLRDMWHFHTIESGHFHATLKPGEFNSVKMFVRTVVDYMQPEPIWDPLKFACIVHNSCCSIMQINYIQSNNYLSFVLLTLFPLCLYLCIIRGTLQQDTS